MARRPEPREMPGMPPRQRRDNWWRYHWLYVLAAVLAVIAVLGILWERWNREDFDCGAVLVTRYAVTPEEMAAFQRALEAVAVDTGGDGEVHVSVSDIQIDYTATDLDDASLRKMTANVDKLHADFYTGTSGLFVLDDPENFQRNHEALRYTDGTEPAGGAVDWEDMVRPWSDSPALSGLSFRNLDTASLWLGRRIGEGFEGEDALWDALFPEP